MRRFDVRWVRLAVAAGAVVGSALVSSVATATDESPPIDELVLVVEPAAPDQVAPDPPVTEPTDINAIGVEQPSPEPSTDMTTEVIAVAPPLDDIVVIEQRAAEPDLIFPTVVDEVDGAGRDGEAELGEPDVVLRSAAVTDAVVDPSESDTEHEGGSGGQGTPNRVTFSVTWLDHNGAPISVLDADWRAVFELSATSQTGHGMPTSATCTYPAGSDVLHCDFDNHGHGSSADGLVVPARATATYTVNVNGPTGWTIEGANDGPYSVRDTCPRGGEGHEGDSGGHEGGETEGEGGHEGGETEGGEGTSNACVHPVVMHKIEAVVTPTPPPAPPVVEPVTEALPPVVAVPVVVVPAVAVPVVVVPVVADTAPAAEPAPSTLAATGGSFAMILLIAGVLVAVGSAAATLTRRTS